MRSEENPLDLNNFPEDYTRDGKHFDSTEDTSSSAVGSVGVEGGYYNSTSSSRKKKSGAKDEAAKIYECRFCSLKFCKSQALGGHMNRHRQERETETLNKARHLVMSNDLGPPHNMGYISSGPTIPHGGGYPQSGGNVADPSLNFRSMYPPRLFQTPSTFFPAPPPPPQGVAVTPPYMYASPQRGIPFSSQYPTNECFVSRGHVLSPTEGNYTYIGAPVGPGFTSGGGRDGTCGGDVSVHTQQEEGLNWARR